ncbi:DUF2252 domain-containing protein [Agromyces sp. NPDC058104]|uniref:DUF2252 domain-containing protein n=1 Tax=Agromyces sp. NPDC058104 TaxID=3346342 RepID=UPI0036D8B4DA
MEEWSVASPEGDDAKVDASDFAARAELGRAARRRVPRDSPAHWSPAPDRPDPVGLLEEQAATRVPELVPIRHARMLTSAFAFFRGAALIMAADLASMPVSGLIVQLCGDAHLSNFGVFGTPERRLVFDINDFDETLPGPWEWDVARLAASCEVAGRHRGFGAKERRSIALAAARGYREQMTHAAESRVLDAWYDRLDAEQFLALVQAEHRADHVDSKQVKRAEAGLAKARTRDSIRAASKLVGVVDGELRIMADPPLIVPLEDLRPEGRSAEDDERELRRLLRDYQATLPLARHPLAEYRYAHMARKVVGVGSVGMRAWILLLRGRDDDDRLLLQAKQAEASVLERFLPQSEFAHHGERVVRGQRLMQAASDLCLGWQRVTGHDGVERDYTVRQLHDWKGSTDLEAMPPDAVRLYARICGATLARAHARSGDRVAIAAYLGSSDRFDRAIAEFAAVYAEQNERDHRALLDAVASGRLEAAPTV